MENEFQLTTEEQDARVLAYHDTRRAETVTLVEKAARIRELARKEAALAAHIEAVIQEIRAQKEVLQHEAELILSA